ncbi:hypothetical protein GX586_03060 [bacterium]|nr:hypothetical protein [bacterium]
MKIIRWPVLTFALLALLTGFFAIGQFDRNVIRGDVESVATEALDAMVRVGGLDMSVYRTSIRLDDVSVVDPGNKLKDIFHASVVDIDADMARFFEKRIVLRSVALSNGYLRLNQTEKGRFDFLSDAAVGGAAGEPTLLRVSRILSWTADQVNPMNVLARAPLPLPVPAPDSPDEVERYTRQPPLVKKEAEQVVRGFRLKLPRDYPDLLVNALSAEGVSIELVPYHRGASVLFHGLRGGATDLSSRPSKFPKPIVAWLTGYVGAGTDSPLIAATSVDLYGGRTNVTVEFSVTNVNLLAALPFIRGYTAYAAMLDIQSGVLTAHGKIEIRDGRPAPGSVYCRIDGFSGSFAALGKEFPWLQDMTVSDTTLEMVVPIDAKRPYFHLEQAFEKQQMRTSIKNFKLKINAKELGGDALDGMLKKGRK